MNLFGVYEVSLDGETYRWEPDEVTVGEEVMILGETGQDTYEDWVDAVGAREAIATQTLIWFLRRQAGRQEDRISVQIKHRRVKLRVIVMPDGTPVPEASAGSDQETSEPATSSPSSTDSESAPATGAS